MVELVHSTQIFLSVPVRVELALLHIRGQMSLIQRVSLLHSHLVSGLGPLKRVCRYRLVSTGSLDPLHSLLRLGVELPLPTIVFEEPFLLGRIQIWELLLQIHIYVLVHLAIFGLEIGQDRGVVPQKGVVLFSVDTVS